MGIVGMSIRSRKGLRISCCRIIWFEGGRRYGDGFEFDEHRKRIGLGKCCWNSRREGYARASWTGRYEEECIGPALQQMLEF